MIYQTEKNINRIFPLITYFSSIFSEYKSIYRIHNNIQVNASKTQKYFLVPDVNLECAFMWHKIEVTLHLGKYTTGLRQSNRGRNLNCYKDLASFVCIYFVLAFFQFFVAWSFPNFEI